ncbi:MAG: 6-carboxytetrahydropterin synthase QueD [Candidatus Riflebacteria bacterium]|nr:6-carboxytetrahydropterin synthase QueD [Candidatus Riflebacteria bacterium]
MHYATVKVHFDAAHRLREYSGKCANLHGHRWEVAATVAVSTLDQFGMSVDFGDIKRLLREAVDRLDHAFLNEIPPFDKINPTAENIAACLFDALHDRIPRGSLKKITVWESPDAWSSFEKDT